MNTTAYPHLPLLFQLKDLAVYYRKDYCYPSQEKLVQLLEHRWGLRITRRTLNRWLRDLERLHLIKRVRRHQASPRGGIHFRSTLYKFTRLSRHIFAMAHRATRQLFFGSRVTNSSQQPSGSINKAGSVGADAPGQSRTTPQDRRRGMAKVRAALTRNGGQ